jgi:Na+/phosphate symporter
MFDKLTDLELAVAIQRATQDFLKIQDILNSLSKEIEKRMVKKEEKKAE